MSMSEHRTPPPAAVALHYGGEGAPRVTASGAARLAERIEALATQHGVPLYRDPELAHLLAQVPLNNEIPPALYRAVSSVIAFAYHMSEQSARVPGDRHTDY
jgi:flagellar biosynthesis protein